MPQTILIIDGPDMCGKTEIAKAMSRNLKIPYFKASSEHSTYMNSQEIFLDQLVHADPRMLDFLNQTKHSVIFDRAYPSEWVYAQLLDRPTNEDQLMVLDAGYAAMGAKLVVPVRSTYEGIVDDLDPEGLDSFKLQELHDLYMDFTQWTDLETLVLNVDDEDLKRECQDIETFLWGKS